jgi:hypothetical protein
MPELSDFDLDLRFGQQGERSVANLLTIDTVEVKTDRQWFKTGNIYIETECWKNKTQQWERSGISTTKATHWAFNLEGVTLIVKTEDLTNCVWRYGRPIDCKIEPNPSRGFLISVKDILEYVAPKGPSQGNRAWA